MDYLGMIQVQAEGEISTTSQKHLTSLRFLWEEIYGTKQCEEKIKAIPEIVNAFLEKIVVETEEKRDELRREAAKLQNLVIGPSGLEDDVLHQNMEVSLCDSISIMQEELEKRQKKIKELLVEQSKLCEQLGEKCCNLSTNLPTTDDIMRLRDYLDTLKGLRQERSAQVLQLRKHIRIRLMALELTLVDESQVALVCGPKLPIKRENLLQLQEMKDEFDRLYLELFKSIESMREKLNNLWDDLSIDADDRDSFSQFSTICQTTHDELAAEQARREAEKELKIKLIVEKIRAEIVHMWEKTFKSDVERSNFTHFTSQHYTVDLLAEHTVELEDLKSFYEENRRIFELMELRKNLWAKMLNLDQAASLPNRFNNRRGLLLQEEKERNKINATLPKIEKDLTELVKKYERVHGKRFTIYGDFLEDMMRNDHETRRQEKQRARKKKQQTPTQGSLQSAPSATANRSPAGEVMRKNASKMTHVKPKMVRKIVPKTINRKVLATMIIEKRRSSHKFKRMSVKIPRIPIIKINEESESMRSE